MARDGGRFIEWLKNRSYLIIGGYVWEKVQNECVVKFLWRKEERAKKEMRNEK